MSETTQGGASAVEQNTSAAPATTPVATPTPEPKPGEPDWLKPRLEQAQKSARDTLLKELGFSDPDALKSSLSELKALKEAALTEQEKAQNRIAELEPAARRAAEMEGVLKVQAESQLAGLSDTQRAAVAAIAGSDPVAVMRTINALSPTWAAAATASVAAAPPAPASTSAAPAAPPAAATTSPTDHYATYLELAKTNPVQAASYMGLHYAAIIAASKK